MNINHNSFEKFVSDQKSNSNLWFFLYMYMIYMYVCVYIYKYQSLWKICKELNEGVQFIDFSQYFPYSKGAMEGWLFIFTFNRLGLCCSHKRYFILKESFLRSFKAKPMSQMKVLSLMYICMISCICFFLSWTW